MTPAPAKPTPNSQDLLGSSPQKSPMEQIIDQYGPTLNNLIDASIEKDVSAEKIIQLVKWKRANMYMRGQHHVYPKITNGQFTLEGFGPTGGSQEDSPAFDYNFHTVSKYGQKYVAVMGSRPFDKCNAVADDPKSEADNDAATEANKCMEVLRSWWDIAPLRFKLAYSLYSSGTTFPYVRWVTNAREYGTYKVPNIVSKPMQVAPDEYTCVNPSCNASITVPDAQSNGMTCTECGCPIDESTLLQGETIEIPVHDGDNQYPNGRAEIVWLNGSQATGAFYSPDMKSQPYFIVDTDEPVGKMMAQYPWLRDKIKDSTGATGSTVASQGALARSSAQSQSGMPRTFASKNLIQWRRLWITADKLQEIDDEVKRKEILQAFPDGLRVVKVGDHIASISRENFLDHIDSCAPVIGEYIMVDGVCWAILGHQDIINDMAQLMVQNLERGMPTTIIEAGLLDVDALARRRHSPQEIIETMPGEGRSLEGGFKTLPGAKFPNQIPELLQWVESDVQSYTGMLPMVFGQSDTTRKTADQVNSELNQALAQLSTAGEIGMSKGFRAAFDLGIKLMARHCPPGMKFNGKEIDPKVLQAGRYHLESGLGIPQTEQERHDALKEFISNANTPIAQAIIGTLKLDSPNNAGIVRRVLGIPDIDDPLDNHRRVVLAILQTLLMQEPAPGPDGNPLPSIPLEDFVLDPQTTLDQVHEFLLDPEVRLQKDTNPAGYANVVLFGQATQQSLMPPPLPDGQLPPDGKTAPDGQGGGPKQEPPAPQPKPPENNTSGQPQPVLQ